MTQVSLDTQQQVALWFELNQFYFHEAWLLDERKLSEWLDLLTDDVLYFMPRRKNVMRRESDREYTGFGQMNFFEDDKELMRVRVARLETDMAWAEDPPSRTTHVISNLMVTPGENDEVHTKTAFVVYKSHLETDSSFYSGWREDVLRREDGGWKIAKRTIYMNANVLLSKNISIFF
jgi:3-phenylpropionate/cinnamic acid dioxygenase small subunit